MKKLNLIQSLMIIAMFMLATFTGIVHATSSDRAAEAKRGTVACSGNFRGDHSSRWIIHNLNDDASITLKRMRVYTAGGTNVYDSLTDGLAPSATVVPFGVIGPYQTLSFRSGDLIAAGLLPGTLPGNQRPVKTLFDWSSTSGKHVLTPYVLLTRLSVSSAGETRHARDCRTISSKKKHSHR